MANSKDISKVSVSGDEEAAAEVGKYLGEIDETNRKIGLISDGYDTEAMIWVGIYKRREGDEEGRRKTYCHVLGEGEEVVKALISSMENHPGLVSLFEAAIELCRFKQGESEDGGSKGKVVEKIKKLMEDIGAI